MQYLKADTETKVVIGPVVAVGDGFTPVTTLALGTADEAELMKHDASAVTDISGNTFAAITSADGYYNLTLTAAQLDTEGRLTVLINDDSLCLPVRHDFVVQNANVYDSLHGAATTDYLQVDAIQISGDATAADNLELQYDGTGLTGDTYPATQSQVGNLAVGAGGISVVAESYTLTTGTQSSGTYTSTEELDGTLHTIDTPAANLEFYYQFDVGVNGVATEILWDGYVGNNGDVVEVYGYDWVSTSWKQVGTINGKNANTVEEHVYLLTSNMTGTGANAGKVRFRLESSGADVAVDINTDRVWCEYTSVAAEALILHSGIAQAGASSTITLDAAANANDDFYNNARVVIKSGTGVEQERIIVDYNGTTKVATVSPPWTTNPDSTSAFDVEAASVHTATDYATVKVGVVAAATSTTVTLDSLASATDDFYNGDALEIHAGTGKGQVRIITDYNGTTKVATVSRAWTTNPDTTSEYFIQEVACDVESVSAQNATATAAVDFDDLASILTDTGEIGTAGAGLTDITINAASVDAIWDEAITTSVHNGANSAGKRLRQASASLAVESTVNDLSASTTVFVTDLTEATDDHYNDCTITFLTGDLAGQSRVITDYAGSTKTITVDEALTSAPADGVEFQIAADHVHSITQIQSGLATAAALATAQADLDTITGSDGVTLATAQGNYAPAKVADILTTALSEAYAADGAAPTLSEAVFLIMQHLSESSISGTTKTVKKLDGSTSAATFTLDDATTPTSITRAT